MLKVGMVGVGNISGIYLENFKNVFKDVQLVAVCDLVRERAEQAQKKYGIPKLYDTMYELFDDPEIDIVLNLTRPYQHFIVSKAALLAGKHVYSEKPLGAELYEGRQLAEIAEERGLMLGGAPDTFMGAGIQTCRKLIDSGVIGEPIGGRLAMCGHGMETWHPDPDFYYQRGGGPLFDMGPYYITALINLLGGVSSVFGYGQISYPTRLITSDEHYGEIIHVNTPTHIEAILHMDRNINVSIVTSFDLYHSEQTNIEIYGTKGTLLVPDPNEFGGTIRFFDGEKDTFVEYPLEFLYEKNSRCLGLDDFAVAIETGRPGRATHKQTLHVLEIMDGILTSAKTGQPYTLTTKFKREAPMDPTLPFGKL